MDAACLNDPDVFPDDAVLGAHLGKSMELWRSFAEAVRTDHASLAVEWRYYNDGKAWLCKVVRKKKAMCWVSIRPLLFTRPCWDTFAMIVHMHSLMEARR